MHEQSIVDALLTLALESAAKAKAKKILKINIVNGAISGAVDESMIFYFAFVCKDTIAAEASLAFTHVPAKLRCRKCEKIFIAENLDFRCPECKESQVDIIDGRDLYLESLEVE